MVSSQKWFPHCWSDEGFKGEDLNQACPSLNGESLYTHSTLKCQLFCQPGVFTLNALSDSAWQRHLAEKIVVSSAFYINTNKKYYEILVV